jgi:hypothetical protein
MCFNCVGKPPADTIGTVFVMDSCDVYRLVNVGVTVGVTVGRGKRVFFTDVVLTVCKGV